jgi:hypothetical protein
MELRGERERSPELALPRCPAASHKGDATRPVWRKVSLVVRIEAIEEPLRDKAAQTFKGRGQRHYQREREIGAAEKD